MLVLIEITFLNYKQIICHSHNKLVTRLLPTPHYFNPVKKVDKNVYFFDN